MSPAPPRFWRRTTVRARLMRLVLLTTVIAVWVAGIAMLSVDVSMYRKSLVSELSTEASILALSTAAALEFDDRPVAERNLSALEARAGVLAAALYTARGELFASYVRPGNQPPPAVSSKESLRIGGDQAELVQPVRRGSETVGYIYLRGRYDLVNRIAAYVGIFVLVTLLSVAVAFLFASRLQARITRPLEVMAGVAREIVSRRDYSLRAQKTSEDETGVVVDAFNNMLEAVQASSQALREADRRKDEFLATLAHELRNPLAPIRHSVRLLESPKIDEQQRQWAREVISRQVQRMADPAGMHELDEHFRAAGVHRIGDFLPAGDLLCGKDSGNAGIAQAVRRRRGAFGYDHAGGGSLRVILRHQIVRHIAGGAAARQRAHDEMVLQLQRSQGCFRIQK